MDLQGIPVVLSVIHGERDAAAQPLLNVRISRVSAFTSTTVAGLCCSEITARIVLIRFLVRLTQIARKTASFSSDGVCRPWTCQQAG